MRQVIDSNLPEGQAWTPAIGEGMDLFFDGMAENWESVREDLEQLAYILDPNKTIILEDLEKEFGFTTNIRLTEAERRMQLAAFVYGQPGNGSEDDLQSALVAAGFNVQVHQNDPAVNPALFLESNFQVTLGDNNAYLGDTEAFLGVSAGELLVIGDVYTQTINYETVLGGEFSYLGDDSLYLGYFNDFTNDRIIFPIPTDPDSWPFVFFVGGTATRDGITGELTGIIQAEIPYERRAEFIRIILRHKPMFTWAGLIVNYI
jgi:hypothetical protein